MKWDTAAEKTAEMLPIPPVMAPYARLHAEKIARQRGLECVTADVVHETEKVYADFMGMEKTGQLRAFLAGTGPMPEMEDELFFSDENALYFIDTCFTKYGENSALVRSALKDMMRSLKSVMEEEGLTAIMADLTPGALHGASRFNIGMTGCPNCCVSPHMKDFGIIMQHRVDITDSSCTLCGECLKMCLEKAIHLTGDGPVIDRAACVQCELCARDCPTGRLAVHERAWRVIAGGGGGHHPAIAVTIENFTTKERVLALLRNAIARLRKARPGESLRTIIQKEGPGAIR
jgi:ferredoxin